MPAHHVPAGLISYLRENPREKAIHQHNVTVRVRWWNERAEPLRGGPVVGSDGAVEGAQDQPISRGHIFGLADDALTSEEGALRLLWHSLAWGTGTSHRNNTQRIRSVSQDPEAGAVLMQAAQISRETPGTAFELLRSRNRNRFRSLGPNFFTKYLYFAGGGDPEHPCLIVDQFVRATLYRETGDFRFRPISQYSVTAYLETLKQLTAWAQEASDLLGRAVAGDEVEKWAFRSGRL